MFEVPAVDEITDTHLLDFIIETRGYIVNQGEGIGFDYFIPWLGRISNNRTPREAITQALLSRKNKL